MAALATAESSPSDVCALESMTIILFPRIQDIKQCPRPAEKANRGNRFHGRPLFSALFVRQEDRLINASAMCFRAAATPLENVYVRLRLPDDG